MKSVKTRSTKPERKTPAPKQQKSEKAPAQHPHPLPPSCCDNLQALIAKRAYELYSERGYQDGSPLDDWLIAEREILGQIPPA